MVYAYDASDFGWTPGFWPTGFSDMGKKFVREHKMYVDHEFVGYIYRSTDGIDSYKIYND